MPPSGSLAAHPIAANRATDQRARRAAEDCPKSFRTARRNRIAKKASAKRAYDQARGPVVAAAIVPAVRSAIDPVILRKHPRLIVTAIAVIALGIIGAIARIGPVVVIAVVGLPVAPVLLPLDLPITALTLLLPLDLAIVGAVFPPLLSAFAPDLAAVCPVVAMVAANFGLTALAPAIAPLRCILGVVGPGGRRDCRHEGRGQKGSP